MSAQETDDEKRASLIGWLERRIEWGKSTLPLYVAKFRMMWIEEFGNEEGIPNDLKRKAVRQMKK